MASTSCWLCQARLDSKAVTFVKLKVKTCAECAVTVRAGAVPYGAQMGRAKVLAEIREAYQARQASSTPTPPPSTPSAGGSL